MSHVNKVVYAASCNPPRRAKRTRRDTSPPTPASLTQPRPLLPKQAALSLKPSGSISPYAPTSESAASTAPSRRGRKPGLLSRSAREAQRRLNHSIIEKARRTKINNALATLKELVPPDYGRKIKLQEHVSEEEEDGTDNDDGDEDYGGDKNKSKAKPARRKEEKEREYKLEILVRTVTFMQDLLQRVAELEQGAAVCPRCATPAADKASKQLELSTEALAPFCAPVSSADPSDAESRGRTKRTRLDAYYLESAELTATSPLGVSFGDSATKHRLPSISSWLPETLLDSSAFNSSPSRVDHQRNKEFIPPLQLLTPPSSTHFDAATPMSVLTTTSASSVPRPSDTLQQQKGLSPMLIRTPEDEHAATMLLQISSSGSSSNLSPVFRPLPPSIIPISETFSSMPSKLTSVVPEKNDFNFALNSGNPKTISIQTPASLLGLMTPIL